jgi:hypothetical protein
MVPGAAMARGAWDEIEQAARSAARLVSETTTRSLPGSAGV